MTKKIHFQIINLRPRQANCLQKCSLENLYYKSPATYKFMVSTGIVLAAPSTIQRWLQETNCLPGINDEVFENIKNKFANKSIKERACVLCVLMK